MERTGTRFIIEVQVERTEESVRDKGNIVDPGQRTGLLIICMCINKPRSKDRAYDLKNQSHKTGY